MSAAALLLAARRSTGLNQAEYAATAGVSQPAISAYERGHREPSLRTLERLVRASGRSLRIDLVWVGNDVPPARDEREQADRLLDVLSLADAIPHQRHERRLLMPRVDSRA